MRKAVIYAAAAFFLAGTAQAQTPPAPEKGKSTQRKPATPARGGYDIKKGTGAAKAPTAGSGSTAKRRDGLENNGTTAQGLAHE